MSTLQQCRKRSEHFVATIQKKKVKNKDRAATFTPQQGKNNAFQRIQSSIERMNRGRAKGYLHQKETKRAAR